MTPIELAGEMSVDPKTLRAWLRRNYPRPTGDKGQPWTDLPPEVVIAARQHFADARVPSASPTGTSAPATKSRSTSDEAYVIDLCDEALAERGLRQHRFDWLLGDPGKRGPARLPVDAFYPEHRIVVEYRERQHDEPVPFMDKADTVSGVKRGEQRCLYDLRREQLIPEHGLQLIVIRPSDLRANSSGRLRRDDRHADLAAVRILLSDGDSR